MVGCKKFLVVSDGFGWFAVLVVTLTQPIAAQFGIMKITMKEVTE